MAMPTIMLYINASVVLLLAHYQVLCYCSLAKPDPQNRSKTLVSQDRYGIVFMHGQNVMADIIVLNPSLFTLVFVCTS